MANVSDWKGFEKDVAEALGGKRRLRTMESYGKEAPDVYWPKDFRHKYPVLYHIIVECKKRRALNIHAFFAEATVKYGKDGKNKIILASKVPRKGSLKKSIRKMQRRFEKKYDKLFEKKSKHLSHKKADRLRESLHEKYLKKIDSAEKKLRARHDISALVTVEIGFFAEMFKLWLRKGHHDKS